MSFTNYELINYNPADLMIKIKRYIFIISAIVMMASACGHKEEKESLNVSAQQLEEAHIAGREAARSFVNRSFKDSLELQQQLIEAAAQAAPYDSVTRLRAAFDSAFISTVRTVRPEVAAELERYQAQNQR